jgi:hypothetical protein
MLDFINKAVSWNKYEGTINKPINGRYLNQIHLKWVRKGVCKEFNKQLLLKYLKERKDVKLKRSINRFNIYSE